MTRASASTAAAEPPTQPRARRLPAWTRRRNPWSAVPEVFWTHVAVEVSPAALVVCGYLLYSAVDEEFAQVQQAELAKKLKMHPNTVQGALDELERAGAIAVRKVGKRNVYDLLVDEWRKVKCRPRPKVEEIAPAEDEEAAEAPAANVPRKPLSSIRLKTGESRAIKLPPTVTCRTVRCENRSEFPIGIEARFVGEPGQDAELELEITEKAVIDTGSVANTALKPTIPSQMTGYPELRAMLNRLLGAHLGFVPDDDLRSIGDALRETPIDHLARRVHQRRSMLTGGKGTWGGVLLLARDCAKAFAAASVAQTAASEPDVSATIAREQAYEAHCNQLFDEWWEAQSAQERAELAKRHTGVILEQFAGAKFWPAAQLAQSVHAAIRAEALKTIAPSFREFAAVKAKGASA